MQKTEPTPFEENEPSDDNARPALSNEELAEIVAQRETEDHLEKLKERLSDEWRESQDTQAIPDLSYETFKRKLDESGQ